ncbi:hypothetical protein RB5498 [Rhodopirellula baltica SH 1]|uniref:Uncharacterized protein n=1 Tax=Rhodopirellula baltica (strain DSM 10527 / NCIMB 13988 / SH1) TaxID=243090 RepID=Q7URR6_RHOBA|nr:hypothetical protein RB5498 [Rhodopirellula baltica SH 1]
MNFAGRTGRSWSSISRKPDFSIEYRLDAPGSRNAHFTTTTAQQEAQPRTPIKTRCRALCSAKKSVQVRFVTQIHASQPGGTPTQGISPAGR